MKLMSTINRISAWVLAVSYIIYMITGFDMQLRFLSPEITSLIHLNYLFLIAQTAFIIHTTYAFYLSLRKRKKWNYVGKSLLAGYFALNLALIFVYLTIRYG